MKILFITIGVIFALAIVFLVMCCVILGAKIEEAERKKIWERQMKEKERKQLLLKIATITSKDFHLQMKDHWENEDYDESRKYTVQLRELKEQYTNQFGKLPEWKYINDVFEVIKQLNNEGIEI